MWFGGSFSFCFQCHTNTHAMLSWRTELLSRECGANSQWSLHVKLGRNWMNVLQQLLCSLEGRLDDPIQLAHSQFLWSLNKKTKHCLNCKGTNVVFWEMFSCVPTLRGHSLVTLPKTSAAQTEAFPYFFGKIFGDILKAEAGRGKEVFQVFSVQIVDTWSHGLFLLRV